MTYRIQSTPHAYVERRRRNRLRCFYDLFALFYDAYFLNLAIAEKYEKRVHALCERYGTLRTEVIQKVSYQEISALFDFEELVRLRTHYLFPFLEVASGDLPRVKGSTVQGFLLHVKHLYHLVSMLSLEELNLVEIAPGYSDLAESESLWEILGEVDREFPTKLREIRSKFEKARVEMEGIVSCYTTEKVTIRSIYLFERSRLETVYDDIDVFYSKLYPAGVFDAYITVAESFLEGRFVVEAVEVVKSFEAVLGECGLQALLERETGDAVFQRYEQLRIMLDLPEADSPESGDFSSATTAGSEN
ncbi:MAG: hypothetical protein QF752_02835 [Planctomycetota bacterium]|jgi:hypothetical protein|nr:hypothetical protein [Planctomycetota bacterium]